MEVILIVVMFSASPDGNMVRERHEYPFPNAATCEKARSAVFSDWLSMKPISWRPNGITAWCRQ